jgi:hypothetical protein
MSSGIILITKISIRLVRAMAGISGESWSKVGMCIDIKLHIDIGSGHIYIDKFYRFRKYLIVPLYN